MCSKASAAVTVGSGSFLSSSSSSLSLLHCAGITSCTMSSNESSRQTHTLSSRLAYSASSVFTLCASRPEIMMPVSCSSSSMLSWSLLLVLKHIM
uniref:Putative secreted protein n=1 Tax=Ixodes ricinus TaxID=34613 RepID=A0A6B0U3H2_IXORI